MAETAPRASQRSLAAQPWVAAAVAFNLSPLKDLDESWLQTLPNGGLVPHLRGAAAERWVSRYLLDAFDLGGRYWDDFSAPRTRLALMDRASLQSVLFHVGLALKSDAFRNLLDGARIKALRDEIGPEAYDFAVKAAPLYGAPPTFDYEPPALPDTPARLMLTGAAFSLHGAAAADAAYITRFAFKLPAALCDGLSKVAGARSAAEEGDALPRLTRRIIKDRVPRWLSLFD
jgi:YOP proteins translocation protein K (YscK)